MSENKINLVVPKDYNGKPIEVVLREGEAPVALDPKEQEKSSYQWNDRCTSQMVGETCRTD